MTRFHVTALFVPLVLALGAGRSGADEDVAARVEAGIREAEAYGGSSFHLTDRIAALGAPAVPVLAAVVADPRALDARRVLAACALGRLRGAEALAALQSALARDDLSDAARSAVEEGCYLQGDTEPIDRRIATLATKHRDLPVAAAGAKYRVARTYAATGRFRIAATLMKELVATERTTHPEIAQSYAYEWACDAALAGNLPDALEAVRVAVESDATDLEWMAKDLDLASVQRMDEFVKLLADAKTRRRSKQPAGNDLENEPGYAEYDALHGAYGKAFIAKIEANNRYWNGYEAWLEKNGKTQGADAESAYAKEMGAAPVDPTSDWIPKFQALLDKFRGTAIGRKVRSNLLTIYKNQRNTAKILELYLAGLSEDPPLESLADHARTALYAASSEHRSAELRAALTKAMAAHPDDPSAAEIQLAMAEGMGDGASPEAVRSAYGEIIKRYPGTPSAKQAEASLYELEKLADGSPAPQFVTEDIQGRAWALSALRGKVVLLDFWATWCGPCLGEIPTLKLIQKAHGDGSSDDFVMLGVSLDADGWALAEFLDREKILWPQICDLNAFDGALAKLYHVTGIPRTVLIDRKGRIVAKGVRGEELKDAVREALSAPK